MSRHELRTRNGLVVPSSAEPSGSEVELRAELLDVRRVRLLDAADEQHALKLAQAFLEEPGEQNAGCLVKSFESLRQLAQGAAWCLTYTEHRLYIFPVPPGCG